MYRLMILPYFGHWRELQPDTPMPLDEAQRLAENLIRHGCVSNLRVVSA